MRQSRTILVVVLSAALLGLASAAAAQTPGETPAALQPGGESPLQGTQWRLEAYRYQDQERRVGPEVAAWIQLRAGRLTGSGGCTKLRGTYSVVGAAVGIELGKVRKPDCGEQATLAQLAMVAGLSDARIARLLSGATSADTRLSILDDSGVEVLQFVVDEPGVLAPDRWRLVAYSVDGQRRGADPGQPAELSFQPRDGNVSQRRSSGDVVGSTGCNGLVGAYFRQADVLSFGELERTDAPCEDPVAAQEEALLSVLQATSIRLRSQRDGLVLASGDTSTELEFVSAYPLEGGTWLLTKLGSGRAIPGTVTLRLDSGLVSGEGPCGAYSGRYATDGTFISFSDLKGSEPGECSARRVERDMLDALSRSVIVERGGSALRLLDTAGALALRLGRPAAS
jgi:heat shock protein HslJ